MKLFKKKAALAIGAFLVLVVGLAAQPAYAHGFGERYDLPVPLWLYITGAGATVLLSFVIISVFVRGTPGLHGYPRVNVLRWRVGRLLENPVVVLTAKLATVALFALTVTAGLFGEQEPIKNLAPTMVWVIWWVGVAYVSALVGDVWAVVNPWKTVFGWAEALYRRLNSGEGLSLEVAYPERLGVWPAFVLFFAFVWVELAYPYSAEPRIIATQMVVYSVITFGGMLVFGKDQWLRRGEAFSVVFGLLAKFAPTEVRVQDAGTCESCSLECRDENGECVNCHDCFTRADVGARELALRPYGAGLLRHQVASPSLLALVLLLLSTVTFDGFTAIPLWATIVGNLFPIFDFMGTQALAGVTTLGLLVFPGIFLGVYAVTSVGVTLLGGSSTTVQDTARAFVFSLIPIALAYHLAHFLSFLLIQGQLVVPLASDPFGFGWDLLGTADYGVNIAIVNARFAWIVAVAAIVTGHIIAVYVSHVVAVMSFHGRASALRSQYPMLVLMVGYTMLSLWIIAQPIVETTGG